MVSNFIAAFGLLLDIVGALLLVRYGLPIAPMDENGNLFNLDLTVMSFLHPQAVAMARSYRVRSKIALGLIVAGFVFQLVAVWVP